MTGTLTLKKIKEKYPKATTINCEVSNFTIECSENPGIVTSWMHVAGEGWGQGFGGYVLRDKFLYVWVKSVLEILEKDNIKNIKPGDPIRIVQATPGFGSSILGIGHFHKDKWFIPSENLNPEWSKDT